MSLSTHHTVKPHIVKINIIGYGQTRNLYKSRLGLLFKVVRPLVGTAEPKSTPFGKFQGRFQPTLEPDLIGPKMFYQRINFYFSFFFSFFFPFSSFSDNRYHGIYHINFQRDYANRGSVEEIQMFYKCLKMFTGLLIHPDNQYNFKLSPGQC